MQYLVECQVRWPQLTIVNFVDKGLDFATVEICCFSINIDGAGGLQGFFTSTTDAAFLLMLNHGTGYSFPPDTLKS